MTIAAFKKKEPTDIIPKGTVVLLNSDEEGRFMTVNESKNGQVYCRWHDDAGALWGEWFFPEEVQIQEEDSPIEFNADFTVEE